MVKCDLCNTDAKYEAKNMNGITTRLCEQHKVRLDMAGLIKGIQEIVSPPCQTAVCSLCGETKCVDAFYSYTDAHGVKRKRSECKQCNLEERKKRRLRKK